jgi:predicted Zn-dependent protease
LSYANNGNLQDGIRVLREAAELDPDNREVWELGKMYKKEGNLIQARLAAEKAMISKLVISIFEVFHSDIAKRSQGGFCYSLLQSA